MASLAVTGSVYLPSGVRLRASGTTTVQPKMLIGADGPDTSAQLALFHRMAITRIFFNPTKGMPSWSNTQMKACLAAGIMPHPSSKDPITAAGVNTFMDGIPAGIKVRYTWHHEPEGDLAAAEYAANWALLRSTADAHPKRKQLTLVGILGSYAETHGKGPWQTWVTGHEDVIGEDIYTPVGSADYIPPATAFATLTAIKAAGWRIMVPELGSPILASDPTGAKYAAWLTACVAYARQLGCEAVSVWNTKNTSTGVDYTLSGAPLVAWQQIVASQ